MRQEVKLNGEVFHTIKEELLNAKNEIIAVTAWFTDSELLDILIDKLNQGVSVNVVIADNQENRKLDFVSFIRANGNLIRVPNKGFGIMHQKFCIVDSKVAIHGSYNWTLNAKKSNNESVIITSHAQTIEALINSYKEIINKYSTMKNEKTGLMSIISGIKKNNTEPAPELPIVENNPSTKKTNEASGSESSSVEFEKILNELIESEIFKFEKEMMVDQGFSIAKKTNGDHQTIPNILDSLYADFINSLDIAEEKKQSLFSKIQELKKNRINKLELERDKEINIVESELKSKDGELNKQLVEYETKIAHQKVEDEKLKNSELAAVQNKIGAANREIEDLEMESVKSKIPWFQMTPIIIILFTLFIYLGVFYSSAGYILIFSAKDAKENQMQGIPIEPMEVFDPYAISKAMDHGGMSLLFISLFVIVPLSVAIVKKFIDRINLFKEILIWVLIFVIDAFLAYKVAKSIHDIDYLAGRIDNIWEFKQIFSDENFYLVFILGAFGLIAFKLFYEKMYSNLEERNNDVLRKKNKVKINQLKGKILKAEIIKSKCLNKLSDIQSELTKLELKKTSLEREINSIPIEIEKHKRFISRKFDVKMNDIEGLVSIYESRIDNKNLTFSSNGLKDRINTFLQGWVNYLHETYSIQKARVMTNDANLLKEQWLKGKIEIGVNQLN